jgi:hypothetical protein
MVVKVNRPKMSIVRTYFHDDCDPMEGFSLQLCIAGRFSHENFFPAYCFDPDIEDSMDKVKVRAKRHGKKFLRKNTERLVKKRGFIYQIDKPIFNEDDIPF